MRKAVTLLDVAKAANISKSTVANVFVTGNDAFVRERYPEISYHPKPAHMPALIAALAELLA